ncbi:MAG: tetratricopeptide repeat protein, partial [Porticoccus sp.]
ERAETASVLYQKMMVAADVEPGDKLSMAQEASVTELAGNLRDEYTNTQYARYGALLLAKIAVEKNDLDAAAEQLQWVADGADEGLELIARLRLARVEAARGNLDLAISMLNIEAKTLASAYAEARGDLYLLKGDKSAAYESYQQALQQVADNRTRSLLELKLNQVAPIMEPAQEEQDDSEEGA